MKQAIPQLTQVSQFSIHLLTIQKALNQACDARHEVHFNCFFSSAYIHNPYQSIFYSELDDAKEQVVTLSKALTVYVRALEDSDDGAGRH